MQTFSDYAAFSFICRLHFPLLIEETLNTMFVSHQYTIAMFPMEVTKATKKAGRTRTKRLNIINAKGDERTT